jgi:two-component system, sensor histidine kinase and response regulator
MIPATILLVDDLSRNLQLAGTILDHAGYEVIPCTSAYRALDLARAQKPQLALLDYMMPEMSGVDLCRALQEFPETRSIPVIFITAAGDSDKCIEAFSAGAVDYITKPFLPAELLARVRTHLDLKISRDRLAELNIEKTNLMRMVAHDLKNPLTAITLSLSLLRNPAGREPELIDKVVEALDVNTDRMSRLVGSLLKVNALEEGKRDLTLERVELNGLITETARLYQNTCQRKQIELLLEIDREPVRCLLDRESFIQVIDNLISNAIKFSPPGKSIQVHLGKIGEISRLRIQDEGPGVPPDEIPQLFTSFNKLSNRPTAGENSTGIGLSIVKQLVEAMRGRVWCESHLGQGSSFFVEFPTID